MEALSARAGSLEKAKALIGVAEPHVAGLGNRADEARVWLASARAAIEVMGGSMRAALLDSVTISTTVAFCQVVSGQFGQAGLRLDAIDQREAAQFGADDKYAARVDLMRAGIAHAGGELPQAQVFLRAGRQAFEKPDADPYYRRWSLRLAASLSPAVVATIGSIQR